MIRTRPAAPRPRATGPATAPLRRAGALVALAGCLALTGCAPWWIPPAPGVPDTDGVREANGVPRDANGVPEGGHGELRCTDGQALELASTAADYVVTGTCGEIAVRGDQIEVELEQTATLVVEGQLTSVEASGEIGSVVVRGDRNAVAAESFGTVTVHGQRNELGAATVTESVEIQGNENTLEADVQTERVNVNGQANAVQPPD